jgi:hypothetical protein
MHQNNVFFILLLFLTPIHQNNPKTPKNINLKLKKIENHSPAAQTNTALVYLIWTKIRIMLKLPVFFILFDSVSGFHL